MYAIEFLILLDILSLNMFCIGKHFSFEVLQISILYIIFVISSTRGEFRFCHYGPQKFRNSDCPYGVMFPKPVPASCIYYANDQSGPYGDAELQTCNSAAKPMPQNGERVDKLSFQALFLDVADPNDKGDMGNLGADCEAECLAEWLPLDSRNDDPPSSLAPLPPQEDPEYDDMVPKLPENEAINQKTLTAQLFQKLLEDDPVPQLAYMRSAMLLQKSFEILRKICDPYIPQAFTEQLYKGFMYLVLKSDEKVVDIGVLEKNEIDEALNRCVTKPSPITITGTICNNYTRITGYSYMKEGQMVQTPYVIKPKSFRWKKYDPFIEGAWIALDFVHGYCFPAHEPNLNYHHIYQTGLEPLFTRTIMQRWPNPPELKRGDSYWNNLLEAKDAKVMMQNLDACVQAGYHQSVFKERLNRPFNKFYDTIGDTAGGIPSGKIEPRKSGSGWKGAITDYWEWYKTNDAFNHYLKSTGGACIKSENDLNNMRAQYDSMCSS